MTLDELVLHNFSLYRGRQVMNLTPRPGKPVILIGGLNGTGKTTVLDALQLALYGKLARCSNRKGFSYDEFLRRSIHRGVDQNEGAAVEVEFRHISAGQERRYRIHRSWSVPNGNLREHFEVRLDGKLDPLLTDAWGEHVDAFIPARIAHLFFFDGEKIEGLADFESSAELLNTAIHSVLGLDLVDRLKSDLSVLERRKRVALKDSEEQKAILEIQGQLEGEERHCSELVQLRASSQNDFDLKTKQLAELEQRLEAEGGSSFLKRAETESARQRLLERVKTVEDDLRRTAEGAAPLLLVARTLARLSMQDRTERTAAENVALAKTLAARDRKTLAKASASGVSKVVLKKLEAFLSADREERETTSDFKSFLKLDDSTRQVLHALQRQILPETRSLLQQFLESHALVSSELLNTERALANVPTQESIADLIERRQRAQIALLNVQSQLTSLDLELEKKRRHIDQLQTRLVRSIDQQVGKDFEKEDTFRAINHSQQVRGVLQQFRNAIVHRHVKQIERLVLDSFQQLLRKQSLISELSIDPERFEVQLRNGDGNVLGADRLSAGERQLLAVSLLWGLARASGRPLPVITDTPLGRLDASHRMHLVERYFPYASHQMLLLSTDEEIDREYYEKLKPWVGHSYRLQFDESSSSTHLEQGYFW